MANAIKKARAIKSWETMAGKACFSPEFFVSYEATQRRLTQLNFKMLDDGETFRRRFPWGDVRATVAYNESGHRPWAIHYRQD